MLVGVALIIVLGATSALAAAAVRLPRFPSYLLATYLAAFAEIVLLAVVLSPFGAFDRTGVAVTELVLLVVAVAVWWATGRQHPPRPQLDRGVLRDPILLALSVAVLIAIGLELILGAVATPNTWDSLTYHLARAAWWGQHGGVEWIPNVLDERQNAFPVNAEVAVLYTQVGTGSERLAALPQLVSQVVMLVAVYGSSRRLDFGRGPSLYAALVLATLPMVALQSTTTQTDLVVTALTVTAVFFLLGGDRSEAALAGVAVGLALGTKLTVVLVLPVLVLLAIVRLPLRRVALAAGAALISFAAWSSWAYVRNLRETGSLLGEGVGRVEHQADPSVLGSLSTAVRVLYRFLDLSGTDGLSWVTAITASLLVTIAAGATTYVLLRRGGRPRRAARTGGWLLLPLAAPLAVVALAVVAHGLIAATRLPLDPSGTTTSRFGWTINTKADEDISFFGPLGALVILPVAAIVSFRWLRRHTTPERGVLALSIPVFIVGIALTYRYNVWLGRFLLLPVAMTAPLLAGLYRRRGVAAGIAVTGICWLALVLGHNALKPVGLSGTTPVWKLTRAETFGLTFDGGPGLARAAAALDRTVAADECVGALLGVNQASYPLFGADLARRVVYLDPTDPVGDAERRGLRVVVLRPIAWSTRFAQLPGWTVRTVGGYWAVATRESAGIQCLP